MKLPDEPHHIPAFQSPSDTGFLDYSDTYDLQDNIAQLLRRSIASDGNDLQGNLSGLYYVHCIIPSLYWTRYTKSLHCAVCSEVMM